jgi:glycosyltransferase involved in cell wall biosynthesis
MKRRIVLVCPAAPLPFGDTAARWFHLLARELLVRGHDVSCLTVSDEPVERLRAAEQALAAHGGAGRLRWQAFPMRTSLPTVYRKLRSAWRPFADVLYAPGVRQALAAELARGYDVLHLEQLWSGWAGLGVPRSLLNVHHLEVIDLEGSAPADLTERKTRLQIARATHRLLRDTERLRLFTPRLLDHVRRVNTAASCWVVPFALDLGLYPALPPTDAPMVGLLGSMHWPPSRSAAERLLTRIWPRVLARVPHARLLVAGWNARRHLAHLLPIPGVTLEENLASPEDFFSRVGVLAYAPGRGSGMKVKVLESMAYGVPVVTTAEGVEGMEVEDGVHCRIAEDDDVLAGHVAALVDDPRARRQLAAAGRAYVADRHTAGPVMERMLGIYEEVAA